MSPHPTELELYRALSAFNGFAAAGSNPSRGSAYHTVDGAVAHWLGGKPIATVAPKSGEVQFRSNGKVLASVMRRETKHDPVAARRARIAELGRAAKLEFDRGDGIFADPSGGAAGAGPPASASAGRAATGATAGAAGTLPAGTSPPASCPAQQAATTLVARAKRAAEAAFAPLVTADPSQCPGVEAATLTLYMTHGGLRFPLPHYAAWFLQLAAAVKRWYTVDNMLDAGETFVYRIAAAVTASELARSWRETTPHLAATPALQDLIFHELVFKTVRAQINPFRRSFVAPQLYEEQHRKGKVTGAAGGGSTQRQRSAVQLATLHAKYDRERQAAATAARTPAAAGAATARAGTVKRGRSAAGLDNSVASANTSFGSQLPPGQVNELPRHSARTGNPHRKSARPQ